MAEISDRERVNQKLRANVHAQFEHVRYIISNHQGSENQKNRFTSLLFKLEGLVSDRSKRLKSDTLRKLLENTQTLIRKINKGSESLEIVSTQEVISREAKLKQKPPLPWRTPDRLEPNEAQEPHAEEIVNSSKTHTKSTNIYEPFQICESERLALRYPTKTEKRAPEDKADVDMQYRRPLPMPSELHKPLFQRRHKLCPAQPIYNKRDQGSYGHHCCRRQMQMRKRVRFKNHEAALCGQLVGQLHASYGSRNNDQGSHRSAPKGRILY